MNPQFPTLQAGRRFCRYPVCILRFFRRCFFSRKSLVVYVCLATLGALLWYGDLWLARRGWEQEKKRLAAAGESLDPLKLLPPLPPDEENFFAIPELVPLRLQDGAGSPEENKRLRMWFVQNSVTKKRKDGMGKETVSLQSTSQPQTPLSLVCTIFRDAGILPEEPLDQNPARELLKSAEQWQPLIRALIKGSQRRFATPLPSPHTGTLWDRRHSFGSWMPLVRSLKLYERAAYNSGDDETALLVGKAVNKIAEGFWTDGTLIAMLVASAIDSMQAGYAVNGMKSHDWSGQWLTHFDESANEERALRAFRLSLSIERTGMDILLQKIKQEPDYFAAFPVGMHQEMSLKERLERLYCRLRADSLLLCQMRNKSKDTSTLLSLDLGLTGKSPNFASILETKRDSEGPDGGVYEVLNLLPKILISPRLFKTAITLERHYLAHKRYPATLEEIAAGLQPRTLADLDGQRLRYRTTADGQRFTVWSIGRNGVDDLAAGMPKENSDDLVLSTEEPAP